MYTETDAFSTEAAELYSRMLSQGAKISERTKNI